MITGARWRYQRHRAHYYPTPTRLTMGKRRSGMASGEAGRNRRRTASIEANASSKESVAGRKRGSPGRGGQNAVSAGASRRTRPPARADALTRAIETQRLQLVRVQAVVLANISILRDSYGLEMCGADICYCCEVVRDILERVLTNLDSFRSMARSDGEPSLCRDAMALAHIISVPRHHLFRAQGLIRLLARVLSDDNKDSYAANLRVVFVALGEILEETLTQLEPMSLGLPTPEPD
jgi:hypothetical protein